MHAKFSTVEAMRALALAHPGEVLDRKTAHDLLALTCDPPRTNSDAWLRAARLAGWVEVGEGGWEDWRPTGWKLPAHARPPGAVARAVTL